MEMTLDEKLTSVEDVLQTSRENATQHLEYVAGVMHLNETIIDQHRKYLDITTSVARSTLELCRKLVSTCVKSGACPSEDAMQTVQGLITGVLESTMAMYLAINTIEQLASQTNAKDSPIKHDPHMRTPQDESRTTHRCSFCGATSAEREVVAGPDSNICANCTRLACAVLGIALQE
jgi:polyhydroxyalkanoate synthesis regulator phasin